MTLAELSLRRPVTATMVFVTLTVIGLIAAFRLPLEQFPDIDAPFLFVQIPYAGSTPGEVERTLTRPIEEALATLQGIQRMQSDSRADSAGIQLEFKWGENIAIKAVEAREKIDAIRDQLPSDLQRYAVQKFSTSDQPVLQVRIAGERDLANAYDLLDRKFKRPLERIPGVARVDIQGVAPPQVQIELSPTRLAAHHIGLNDLYRTLRQANFAVSAGHVDAAGIRYQLQPQGEWRSLDDIRRLVLNRDGLRLGDVATVGLRPARLDYARRLDMHPAVGIDISRERNANLVQVGRAVMRTIDRARHDPELRGIRVYTLSDQAKCVVDSLRELGEAGAVGVLLSVLVLYFFLRDVASTLMVSLAIPLCLVMTLGAMHFFGISLNILSMMGLLLAVGMLVDNAVVVVESIYQYREQHPGRPWYSAVQGTQAVGIAIAAGTFTSIVVFLPNIFGAKNDISIFLTQVAVTMAIAHLASWLVAVSLIPMLSAKLPPPRFIGRVGLVSRLRDRYARLVGWTLQHRRWSLLALAALLTLSVVPMLRTQYDMFASGEARQLQLQYTLNGTYRLGEIEPWVAKVERYLLAHKRQFEIRSVYSYYDEQGNAVTNVLLTEGQQARIPASRIMESIRKGLPRMPIGAVDFRGQNRGGGSAVEVTLRGDSDAHLHELAGTVLPVLARLPALRDVRLSERGAGREVAVQVDRTRAALLGFNAQTVAEYIAIGLRGMPLREYREGDRELPAALRFRQADAQRLSDLSGYTLRRADGAEVPLTALVRMDTRAAAGDIRRINRQTALPIGANLAPGRTLEQARGEIKRALDALTLPAGYRWSFGESFDESQQAGNQMLFNTLIALVLVYVVMCAMFESLVFPAAILTTFVFSVFGVFWLFWLSGTTFSIMASIGILILMGVVVNNGIVMIVHINQLRHAGLSRGEALVAGARDRLRPILMTMGTAILGMLPLCFSTSQIGGDGPPYYPMARAIAGGLLFSTVVTLLALPLIYSLLDDARMALRRVIRDARSGAVLRRHEAP